MNERSSKNPSAAIDELPDRIAHRRKIAERIALDSPEYAASDPTRNVDRQGTAYRVFGQSPFSGSGRGSKV